MIGDCVLSAFNKGKRRIGFLINNDLSSSFNGLWRFTLKKTKGKSFWGKGWRGLERKIVVLAKEERILGKLGGKSPSKVSVSSGTCTSPSLTGTEDQGRILPRKSWWAPKAKLDPVLGSQPRSFNPEYGFCNYPQCTSADLPQCDSNFSFRESNVPSTHKA